VGVDLGGILTPIIAEDYPQAKLVLIATNPKMKPETKGLKTILDLVKNKNYIQILDRFKFLPQKIFFNFYQFIIPLTGNANGRDKYLADIKTNINYIIAIPLSEESEVVKFVTTTDNTELLKTLNNKAIVFLLKITFQI